MRIFKKKWLLCHIWMSCLLVAWFAAARPADAGSLDDALDAYWETQDVPAVSGNPCFENARRFEIAVHLGVIPTDDFYTYFPITLDIHYRFTEMWGIMLRGGVLMIHADSTLSDFMDRAQSSVAAKMLGDEQKGDILLLASFHPVYGKWTAGTVNLGRFDWGIFVGIGAVFSESVKNHASKRELTAHPEGAFGMDAHIFFLEWLALRFEASLRLYHAPGRYIVPATLSVGVGFFFPQL